MLSPDNKNAYTFGPLIHNKQVVDYLEQKNIFQTDNPQNLASGSSIVIRSHGIGKSDYDALGKHNLKIIDATCPFVKNIHKIVHEYYNKGYQIIIFGDEKHPEVIGINGWCDNTAVIFSDFPSRAAVG